MLLIGGVVRCWGRNKHGELGYGHTNVIGDEPGEMPPPDVPLGAPALELAAGSVHTCARLVGGDVRCWGGADTHGLGYPGKLNVGDGPGEMPPPDVNIGGSAARIFAGNNGTCVSLGDKTVRCWGSANAGLGYDEAVYATFENGAVGDIPEEMPPPDIYVEGPVVRINGVNLDTCALFADGHVRCWGSNSEGYLGLGHTRMVWNGPGPAVALGGQPWGCSPA